MKLCFLDLETTGLQIGVDKIVSIAAVIEEDRGSVGGTSSFGHCVNPGRPIPKEVEDLIGISDEDVRDLPPFSTLAPIVADVLAGCVLVGFNIHNFDLPILAEEMLAAGVPFDWQAFTVIDCGSIFKKKEERTLTAALQFYCGETAENAHNAMADVNSTRKVFRGQLELYPDLRAMSVTDLAEFSRLGDKRVDPAGKLAWKDGKIVYNFGKSKGQPVADDLGLAFWMLDRDFPATTKAELRKIIEGAAS